MDQALKFNASPAPESLSHKLIALLLFFIASFGVMGIGYVFHSNFKLVHAEEFKTMKEKVEISELSIEAQESYITTLEVELEALRAQVAKNKAELDRVKAGQK